MKISDFELKIGIEAYYTPYPGIGGKLRSVTEDFLVEEIFSYPEQVENGNFVIAEVSNKNWETHRLVKELSKKLHISRMRIGFAGTKDKRSYSTQLMSFKNITKDELKDIKLKDVSFDNIYSSNKAVNIGKLIGNKFRIVIRNIDKNVSSNQIQKIVLYLKEQGGYPNYYGIQRFGVVRPITHLVGKHIVQGDFEKAVMKYIGYPIEGEPDETYELRKELEKTKDFSKALDSYPVYLNFEKAILNKLVLDPNDFVSALKELPKNLLTMFINAYQSYLFNKILSKRICQNIPLNKAIIGDIIIPIRKDKKSDDFIFVKQSNIEKVNKQISKKKAFVSGLLVGNNPIFSNGEMGEIEHSIIEQEKIDYRDFIVPEISFISSSGSRRALFATITDFDWKLKSDKFNKGKQELNTKFELQKGCYATSLLREFMKSSDAMSY